MRPVTAIANAVVSGSQQRAQRPVIGEAMLPKLTPEAQLAVEELVNRLFRSIRVIRTGWRQAWTSTEVLEAAKVEWVKAFVEAGITDWDLQVEMGLRWLRQELGDFVPSPGRFVASCRPTAEMLGLPTAAAAYREACRNSHPAAGQQWSHAAVHHAACETGFHELRCLPEDKSRALFERAYAVTVRMVLAGEPLREIPKALPEDVRVSTPEVGRDALAALRRKVRGVAA